MQNVLSRGALRTLDRTPAIGRPAMTAPHRIDVHHHILPPSYVKAVGEAAIGQLLVSGKAPLWSPQIALDVMDRNGIAKAYTSMSAPGVCGCGEAETAAIVRAFNDDAADLRKTHPARFGTFSYLPLPHVRDALTEISRVSDVVGTDGFGLLTSYGSRLLGDSAFASVFDELNRRKAVVFVHPDSGPCACHIAGVPAATIEFPFEDDARDREPDDERHFRTMPRHSLHLFACGRHRTVSGGTAAAAGANSSKQGLASKRRSFDPSIALFRHGTVREQVCVFSAAASRRSSSHPVRQRLSVCS